MVKIVIPLICFMFKMNASKDIHISWFSGFLKQCVLFTVQGSLSFRNTLAYNIRNTDLLIFLDYFLWLYVDITF